VRVQKLYLSSQRTMNMAMTLTLLLGMRTSFMPASVTPLGPSDLPQDRHNFLNTLDLIALKGDAPQETILTQEKMKQIVKI
jgi:hypothetical protein